MRPSTRLMLGLTLLIVALGLAVWLVASVSDLHDRLARQSPVLGLAFVALAVVMAFASALAAARLLWTLGRPERAPARAPTDVVQAAEVQAEKAEAVVAQVLDPAVKARLGGELASLRADGHRRRFHVVVFGTGSAGKTALVNALLGRSVGKTEAVMGTTRAGEAHTHTL